MKTLIAHVLVPVTALGLLGVTGCDPDSEPEPEPEPGPTPDPSTWPDDLSPYTIDTRFEGTPTGALVAFQDGETWRAATETAPGIFRFAPTGKAVAYAIACPPSPDSTFESVGISVEYTTLGRHRVVGTPCHRTYRESPYVPFTLSVTPADAQVSLSNGYRTGWNDGSEQTFQAQAGTADIVATTADRILILRGVSLPPTAPIILDVERNGTELGRQHVVAPAGEPDEVVTTSVSFSTAGGAYGSLDLLPGSTEARVVPSSLLREGDYQTVGFYASKPGAFRSTSVPLTAAASARLPAPVRVTTSWQPAASVSWTGRTPTASALSLSTSQSRDDGNLSIYTNMSSGWLAATGQDVNGTWTIPSFGAAVGWDATWGFDRSSESRPSWSLSEWIWDEEGRSSQSLASNGVLGEPALPPGE